MAAAAMNTHWWRDGGEGDGGGGGEDSGVAGGGAVEESGVGDRGRLVGLQTASEGTRDACRRCRNAVVSGLWLGDSGCVDGLGGGEDSRGGCRVWLGTAGGKGLFGWFHSRNGLRLGGSQPTTRGDARSECYEIDSHSGGGTLLGDYAIAGKNIIA
ncbi:hypothetical protein Tco_0454670 [Tanacetum coccineum]